MFTTNSIEQTFITANKRLEIPISLLIEDMQFKRENMRVDYTQYQIAKRYIEHKQNLLVEYLTQYSLKFLSNEFGILDVPTIMINGRLKTKLGKFRATVWNNSYKPDEYEIHLSKELLIDGYLLKDFSQVLDVLKHELVHYALYVLGQPFRDTDKYFMDTLDRLNISHTETATLLRKLCEHKCDCRTYATTQKKNRHKCARCNGKLEFTGYVIG